MSEAKADATAGPPPMVDPQDPLPEGSFTYRRLLTFLISISVIILLWRVTGKLGEIASSPDDKLAAQAIAGLIRMTGWALLCWGLTILLYLVAPTAEQLGKLLATLSALKSGVSFRSSASASSVQGSAQAEKTAGKEVAPSGDGYDWEGR